MNVLVADYVARAGRTADSSLYYLLMSISSHLLHKLIVSNPNQTINLFTPQTS